MSAALAGDNVVAAQWVMKGTNAGPSGGGPPTGQSGARPGTDFIAVEGDQMLLEGDRRLLGAGGASFLAHPVPVAATTPLVDVVGVKTVV